jgi:hypothetical protein
MRHTGQDMQSKYIETSLGDLAVNLAECGTSHDLVGYYRQRAPS